MTEKQKIVAGAKQYATYITSKFSQKDENGKVKYYFSGSLAMLLLSSAKSIKTASLDIEGKVVSQSQEIAIPQKNIDSLSKGVRELGLDVDVISIDDEVFDGGSKEYSLRTVKEHCDLAVDMCPKWKDISTTMYFDYLGDGRVFESYDTAELTMQDGSKVIVADPISLIVHKFADSIKCKMIIDSLSYKGKLTPERELAAMQHYERDLRDFSSIFNGIVALYPDLDCKELVNHAIEACPCTAFADVINSDCGNKLEQFVQDASKQIEDDNKNLFGEFMGAIKHKNIEMLENNSQMPVM